MFNIGDLVYYNSSIEEKQLGIIVEVAAAQFGNHKSDFKVLWISRGKALWYYGDELILAY